MAWVWDYMIGINLLDFGLVAPLGDVLYQGDTMTATHYLACDLGAESGRVMLGTLEAGRISLRELHRFPSAVVRVSGTLRWDVLAIYQEILRGLCVAGSEGIPVVGVSADSWGVDYVLLKAGEPFLGVPFHYRDARTDDGFERVFRKVSRGDIFARTGIQFMTLNTLYQLNDDVEKRPELLAVADGFLNIADYFNYLLSGVPRAEVSLASTTQMYDPRARQWAGDIARAVGFECELFPELVSSGTVLGPLSPGVVEEVGLAAARVVATCSHDTAAAVAAVPAEGEGWAYLSSGTWSLLGVELPEPLMTGESERLNFTNEVGYGGRIRFLKNIVGLWVVQECRRAWAAEGREFDYGELAGLAADARPLRSLIQPVAARFSKPGNMPEKIASYCRETTQPVPETPGEFVRCALESLALLYGQTLRELRMVTGREIQRLHIVGGGSRNALLNQLAADATGLTVRAGPVEATALGNVLIQAIALGHLKSLEDLRRVVRDSFDPQVFAPAPADAGRWEEADARFSALPIA